MIFLRGWNHITVHIQRPYDYNHKGKSMELDQNYNIFRTVFMSNSMLLIYN